MNRGLLSAAAAFLLTGAFLAGAWVSHRSASPGAAAGGRKVLHYVDPMHPSYTSDKPGIAPDCGMQLEPVYADGPAAGAGAAGQGGLPPGSVQVSAEQQQLIGVRVGEVERTGGSQNLRLQGRVVPDELRTYVINATIDGWITGVGGATTGSLVKKDELLGTFYSPEFLSAGQALIYALTSMDRSMGTSAANQAQKDQMQQFNVSLKQYRDALRNLGMGELQIDEMIKTRKYMENVNLVSPGNGLVLTRNISPGQRFERGKELFRIADLSRIWVLVDTYGGEVDSLKPGTLVKVALPNRNRSFQGRVSKVPPQFDPASRTLKVRLEVDNPGYLLRPDMFVDVELPSRMPEMLAVPAEALLDTGLKKTVYVERGPGSFEPREVETGRSWAGRVEVVSGLKAGERIALSGTFLLDSESRMKSAAAGITGTPRQDPVCGMYLDEAKARSAGRFVTQGADTSFFCSEECRLKFLKKAAAHPARETQTRSQAEQAGAPGPQAASPARQAKLHPPAGTVWQPQHRVASPAQSSSPSPATPGPAPAPMAHDMGGKP
jgi:membrane fusion protein, copper/silver efflux system